jgi:hypothetical protein
VTPSDADVTIRALPYCDRCGKPAGAAADHVRCASSRDLEPPRYCAECGRRLVVQVLPRGWTARCSAHGPVHDSVHDSVHGEAS